MHHDQTINELPLTAKGSGGGCCGGSGGCMCGHADEVVAPVTAAHTAEYLVTGMTCNHCVASVTEELGELSGVADVRVQLNAHGISRVTVASSAPLELDDVRDAILDAGYQLQEA